ncbi:hypothetical protein MRX96_011472 [Rhipicephalus microplus]
MSSRRSAFEVGEALGAARAAERGATRRVALLGLNLAAHVIELVLDHVHEHLVVNVVIVLAGRLAVAARLHAQADLDEAVALQLSDHGSQLLLLQLEEVGQVVLLDAGVPNEHVDDDYVLHAVEASNGKPNELLERTRHLCHNFATSFHGDPRRALSLVIYVLWCAYARTIPPHEYSAERDLSV